MPDYNDPGQVSAAADHWERLASEAEDLAKWNRDNGFDLSLPGMSVGDYNAEVYRRTAQALRLQAETGKEHCSICLGAHPNHLHMHRG